MEIILWKKLGIPIHPQDPDERKRKEGEYRLQKIFENISEEMDKPETADDRIHVSSPIDDIAQKVKGFIRDVDQKANTKKADKAIDGIFGVLKKAIREVVTDTKNEVASKNPVLSKMRGALQTAVTDVSTPLKTGLGDRIARKFPNVFNAFIAEPMREQAIYILNKQNQFNILRNCYRPTIRAPQDRSISEDTLRKILFSYLNLQILNNDVTAYIKLLARNIEEYHRWYYDLSLAGDSDLIAAAIDCRDQNVIDLLTTILSEETCELSITPGIVRGIVKSDDVQLRRLLIDFMLKAGLQEGVRQCICENMDSGTIEAQIDIFKAICEHHLIRYSSVRRALATQTGINDDEKFKRISDRLFDLMKIAILEPDRCEELIQSTNHLRCHIGLWGIGIRDRQKCADIIEKLIYEGKREQMIVAHYHACYYFKDKKRFACLVKYIFNHYADDPAMLAAWFRYFIIDLDSLATSALHIYDDYRKINFIGHKGDPIPIESYFESTNEARQFYDKLSHLLEKMPSDGYIYKWDIARDLTCFRSEVIASMFIIAWMLQDNALLSELAPLYTEAGYRESTCFQMAVWNPVTPQQRSIFFKAMISQNRCYIINIIDAIMPRVKLDENDYAELETYFRLKNQTGRNTLYRLFMNAPDNILLKTTQNLLKSRKKEMRSAGLELVKRMKDDENRKAVYGLSISCVRLMDKVTPDEQIVIQGILDEHNEADDILKQPGYGIYDPNEKTPLPPVSCDKYFIKNIVAAWYPYCMPIIHKLEALIEANRDLQYEDAWGNINVLGENFNRTVKCRTECENELETIDCYPYPELWKKFYDEEINSFECLFVIHLLRLCGNVSIRLFNELFDMNVSFISLEDDKYLYHVDEIIEGLFYLHAKEHASFLSDFACCFISGILSAPPQMTLNIYQDDSGKSYHFYHFDAFVMIMNAFRDYASESHFRSYYIASLALDRFYGDHASPLSAMDHILAYSECLISRDEVYQALFGMPMGDMFDNIAPYVTNDIDNYNGVPISETVNEIYQPISELIVSTELKRSEQDTPFSQYISRVPVIRGTQHLVDILVALGDDIFDREAHYAYHTPSGKRFSFTKLVMISEPAPGEIENTLRECLKCANIPEQRLADVAMINNKWAPIIEKCLGWDGMTSGVYYFTAHMGELFNDKFNGNLERKKAIFARYTPISFEDLQQGAMDIRWFKEAYNKLGDEHFQILYKSAKYISETNKHTRARKYADAVLGKYQVDDTENQILDKRNKDLLMAYALIPLVDLDDCLRRYKFIHEFKKSSKAFGSQRRTSESIAVQMAIRNLAANAGFEDDTRLILYMESKLTDEIAWAFDWVAIQDDVQVRLALCKENYALSLECQNHGKLLKSIPSKYGKHETVVKLREINQQLRDQISRTRQMFEEFMEKGTELKLDEIQTLMRNRISGSILQNLVFMLGNHSVYYGENGFENPKGIKFSLTPRAAFRIAHPYDLYQCGDWAFYQKYLFEHQIRQPFKQVFRELYLLTDEEREMHYSYRFAGNQIKPRKTVGCLKGRRWVADYEEGLQKIYYKENIVAHIYAIADWFSPSDIEYPTIEYVEFYDRNTYEPLLLKDIPPVVFSEVMRDVDLAVSVAHAGEVDPETSHSTIEMRKLIAEYNMTLFGFKNVSFTERHAHIEGKRASYNIHLGSGVIFQIGGAQIAVLPVHSQHRGKLFLPFIDEDPQTAEIMTKIIFFANDLKIKDPYILNQIRQGDKPNTEE
ncbi:MAG: DUF4132 domain-containing protein [Proteobacteria bacterium]|nr:DUF4132 domain-containing protein [Pseudomonadota bacterium]